MADGIGHSNSWVKGAIQKWEKGLAYILMVISDQGRTMLVSYPEEAIGKEATEQVQGVRPVSGQQGASRKSDETT